jgi:uncharacterized protein
MALNPELIRDFVISAHGNFAKTQEMLATEPSLLNAQHQWGENDFEDALGAAAHVGNREIALYLLEQGAPTNICVEAMLGEYEKVKARIEADNAQANATGAHGISLLFHAAMSGDTRITDVIRTAGGNPRYANHALHGAVAHNRAEMVRWLLHNGVIDVNTPNFEQKTPLRVALDRGFGEVAEILRAAGGKESV